MISSLESRALQPVATFVLLSEDLQGFLTEQAVLLPKSWACTPMPQQVTAISA